MYIISQVFYIHCLYNVFPKHVYHIGWFMLFASS